VIREMAKRSTSKGRSKRLATLFGSTGPSLGECCQRRSLKPRRFSMAKYGRENEKE
jgi:hypothetical protein